MRLRIYGVLLTLAIVLVVSHAVSIHAQRRNSVTTTTAASTSDGPLVLAKQGSFFVNPQNVDTALTSPRFQ